jgi:hypothetical protein
MDTVSPSPGLHSVLSFFVSPLNRTSFTPSLSRSVPLAFFPPANLSLTQRSWPSASTPLAAAQATGSKRLSRRMRSLEGTRRRRQLCQLVVAAGSSSLAASPRNDPLTLAFQQGQCSRRATCRRRPLPSSQRRSPRQRTLLRVCSRRPLPYRQLVRRYLGKFPWLSFGVRSFK